MRRAGSAPICATAAAGSTPWPWASPAGATIQSAALVEEISRLSPEFEALWRGNDVVCHGEGLKRLHHPELGLLELEFSAFAVDGRPDLGMIVYNPATAEAAERMRAFIGAQTVPHGPPIEIR